MAESPPAWVSSLFPVPPVTLHPLVMVVVTVVWCRRDGWLTSCSIRGQFIVGIFRTISCSCSISRTSQKTCHEAERNVHIGRTTLFLRHGTKHVNNPEIPILNDLTLWLESVFTDTTRPIYSAFSYAPMWQWSGAKSSPQWRAVWTVASRKCAQPNLLPLRGLLIVFSILVVLCVAVDSPSNCTPIDHAPCLLG